MRGLAILLACGLGALGGSWACMLDIEPGILCGDGFVDVEAGEECDPLDESSYEGACREINLPAGESRCDENTCQIIATPAQCATCGDGRVDANEECDGTELRDAQCPGNAGVLRCSANCTLDYSQCESCGDGDVDRTDYDGDGYPDEECDPEAFDSIGTSVYCAGNGETPELQAPIPGKPYESGTAILCGDDCRWNRLGCGYCGDGVIDKTTPVDIDGTPLAQPETCDGERFDIDDLNAAYPAERNACQSQSAQTGLDLRVNRVCNDECNGFAPPEGGGATCCVTAGSACPSDESGYKCCYEYAHPEDALPCQSLTIVGPNGPQLAFPVCRPITIDTG